MLSIYYLFIFEKDGLDDKNIINQIVYYEAINDGNRREELVCRLEDVKRNRIAYYFNYMKNVFK